MSHPPFKVNVSGIVRNEDKFLLIRRSDDEEVFPGLWGIPGGTVEPSDPTLEHALKREFREEVGIEIGDIDMVANDINDKGDRGALYVVYTASYAGGDLKPLDGTAEADWLNIEAIRELQLTPKTLEIIETCVKKPNVH